MEEHMTIIMTSTVIVIGGILLSLLKKDTYWVIVLLLYAISVLVVYYPLYFIIIVWLHFDSTLTYVITFSVIVIISFVSSNSMAQTLKKCGIRPKDER